MPGGILWSPIAGHIVGRRWSSDGRSSHAIGAGNSAANVQCRRHGDVLFPATRWARGELFTSSHGARVPVRDRGCNGHVHRCSALRVSERDLRAVGCGSQSIATLGAARSQRLARHACRASGHGHSAALSRAQPLISAYSALPTSLPESMSESPPQKASILRLTTIAPSRDRPGQPRASE